jgi:pimeloyl-ACP methyl ester carboxylesterase
MSLELETDTRFRRVAFPMKDGEITGVAFGDETRPVDIIFLHATGFNARTYAQLLAPLGERFHVLAIDLRGHGRTTLPPKLFGYTSWNRHRDDVIALMETHIRTPATFAGHSMGATTSLLVAGKRPDFVRSLALIDPVIMPEARYGMLELPFARALMIGNSPIARGARRRRAAFASREEAMAALTGRGFFRTVPLDVLYDYVADGFRDDEGGGVTLACTPAYEAATFGAQRNDPWRPLVSFNDPVVILRAEIGSTCPPAVAKRIKDVRPNARMAVVEGATHALPMERPDRVRSAIETATLMARPNARFVDLD